MRAGSAISRFYHRQIGDVLVAQGNLAEALKSYQDSLASATAWPRPTRQCRLAARSLRLLRQGRRRAGGAGQPRRGAEILPGQPRHQRPPGQGRPQQCRLAARSLGLLQQGRRRAAGARQARRGAEILPGQPRHSRPPGQGRPRAMPAGSAISPSPTTRSATCWWRKAISPRR